MQSGSSTQSQVISKLESISIQFTGRFTEGLVLPRVKVFQGDEEVHFAIDVTVVPNRCSMPYELIIPERDRHNANLLWRSLKRYLTCSVFLPSVGCDRYDALMYEDWHGHHHALFDGYDFTMLTAFAAFLRVCQEQRASMTDCAAIASGIVAADQGGLFSGFVTDDFVRVCLSLLNRFGLPYLSEQQINLRLASITSSALTLQRTSDLKKIVVPNMARKPPMNGSNGFALSSTAAGAVLAQLRSSLVDAR